MLPRSKGVPTPPTRSYKAPVPSIAAGRGFRSYDLSRRSMRRAWRDLYMAVDGRLSVVKFSLRYHDFNADTDSFLWLWTPYRF